MTFSATPLSPEGFKDLRARLTFAMREETATPLPSRIMGARGMRLPFAVCGLVGAAGLLLIAVLEWSPAPVTHAPPIAPVVPVIAAPPSPAWTEVIRPFTAYDLAGGPFAKLPLAYAARRDAAGTARQDTLTYGSPVPGEPFLRLMFYRHGTEPEPATTGFVDTARLAAGVGLAVTRGGLVSKLATRFGSFEVAGVDVARSHRSAACLSFRLADPASLPVLEMTGLACGTDEKPVDLASLACTIEKIDLVSAGDDEDLRGVFVAAERHRGLGCREERGPVVRPGWPDEGRPVRSALKGPL